MTNVPPTGRRARTCSIEAPAGRHRGRRRSRLLRRDGPVDGGQRLRARRGTAPTLEDLRTRFDDPPIRDGVRDCGGRVTLAIFECTKPVIAAINGPAVGIGATMTLAMDVRLASDAARIGVVLGRLGSVSEPARPGSFPASSVSRRHWSGCILPRSSGQRMRQAGFP